MKTSAGLLVYRKRDGQTEVLLGHIGGPWKANQDKGAWSIIKGEYTDEKPEDTARREFKEETSFEVPEGQWLELGTIKQKSGKQVIAWAVEGDLDETKAHSNMAKVEWPPRSGQILEYPETDRLSWFSINKVNDKLVSGQAELIARLAKQLGASPPTEPPSQAPLF